MLRAERMGLGFILLAVFCLLGSAIAAAPTPADNAIAKLCNDAAKRQRPPQPKVVWLRRGPLLACLQAFLATACTCKAWACPVMGHPS